MILQPVNFYIGNVLEKSSVPSNLSNSKKVEVILVLEYCDKLYVAMIWNYSKIDKYNDVISNRIPGANDVSIVKWIVAGFVEIKVKVGS